MNVYKSFEQRGTNLFDGGGRKTFIKLVKKNDKIQFC